ncbi:MAG TPA: hypothetical protein VFN62_01500, partial [Acidobacteriaceae bacterium]|nr:hypothetical protein [Acidobacteriaceae bacterium]
FQSGCHFVPPRLEDRLRGRPLPPPAARTLPAPLDGVGRDAVRGGLSVPAIVPLDYRCSVGCY